MNIARRSFGALAVCWLCAFFVVLSALVCCGGASAIELVTSTDGGAYSRDTALVIPNAQWLLGYEQLQAQTEARRANPLAAEAREASAASFAKFGAARAAALARSSFPQLVSQTAGGLPKLGHGVKLGHLVGDYAASIVLPGGKRGVVETSTPISVKTGSRRVPVDLHLRESHGKFVPKTPPAGLGLTIPRRLASGPSLSSLGLSLIPVDRYGAPLSSSNGVIDGATVFYGDSASTRVGVTDTDTLVKPEPSGFSEETILRSEHSPKRLFFKVGLPHGAHLTQPRHGGQVLVSDAGHLLAVIAAPEALDAEGASIPLSLSFSGHTIEVKLERHAGQYRFPIAVDPSVTPDWQVNASGSHSSNWHFASGGSAFTGSENSGGAGWTEHIAGTHTNSEWGAFEYTTQGNSTIEEFNINPTWQDKQAHVVNELLIVGPGGVEAQENVLAEEELAPNVWWGRCAPEPACAPETSGHNNSAEWLQRANAAGTGTPGENTLKQAVVTIRQATRAVMHYDTTDPEVGGVPNALYGSNWLGRGTAIKFTAEDPGIGVSETVTEYQNSGPYYALWKKSMVTEGLCSGVQCPPKVSEFIGYSPLFKDGEISVAVEPVDLAGWTEQPIEERRRKVRVDGTPPHNIVISGLPSNHQIGLKSYTLKAEASDGSGATASSGVKSITLTIDGRAIGSSAGSCTPGPCTAQSSTWTINGNELAGGEHSLEVTALDYAGNEATESVTVSVPVAHPIQVGPGEVTPRSGEYQLQATDVSQGEGLEVSRSYGSQSLTAGAKGPLGPQWAISTGSLESLELQPDGSVALTDGSGRRLSYAKNGSGGFVSPPGDANLALTFHETAGVKEYVLTNAAKGTSTRFTLPSGGGTVWVPTIQEGTLATETATETTTDSYETVEIAGKKVTRPIKELAPIPAGVSCSPELKAGCRALTFNYATTTTASGESSSGWGDYTGNLTRVYMTAYEPVLKTMTTVTVAQYAYDTKGRLRAEWDPRLSPALKVEYGYDAEGHVTALTPPGEETWAFTYGTIPGDVSPGRLLRTTQAPASASLWGGSAPVNTVAPVVTPEQPQLGVNASASAGTWSGSPVSYRYQWQRCNASGAECVVIPGAMNEAYKPTLADAGRTLKVEIQATNGGGSAVAYSSAAVVVLQPTYSAKFGSSGTGNGQFKYPAGSAVDASGNLWVADKLNNRIEKFSASGEYLSQFGAAGAGNGQFKEPGGVVVTPEGNLWVADKENNRIQEFSAAGAYIRQVGVYGTGAGQFYEPWGLAVDPSGNVWVTDMGNQRVEEFSSTGTFVRQFGSYGFSAGQFDQPVGIATDSQGHVWVLDVGSSNVQEFSSTGTYMTQFGSEGSGNGQFRTPWGLTIDSAGNIWVTDEGNNRIQEFSASGQYITKFGSYGEGEGQFKSPQSITVSGSGTIYVSDTGNQRIQTFTMPSPSVSYGTKFGSFGTGNGQFKYPDGSALDASGNLWVVDTGNNRVEKFSSSGTYSSQFGSAGVGNGQLKRPMDVAVTPEGNLWVTDEENNRIQEFTASGAYVTQVGTLGTGAGQFDQPYGISVDKAGNVWVVDMGNHRVEEFSSTGAFVRQFGSSGTGAGQFTQPTSVAVDSQGHVWVLDLGNHNVQEFSSTGTYMTQFGSYGEGNGQFVTPWGLAIDSTGNIWVGDERTERVEEFSATGQYITKFGSYGEGNGQFAAPDWVTVSGSGTVYISDLYNHRIQTFTIPTSTSEAAAPPAQTGALTTIEYNVPVSGAGAPFEMGGGEVAKWSQTDVPNEAIAIFPPDEPVGWPAPDYKRATVHYLDEKERAVNVASPAGGITTAEYNEANDVTRTLGADNRASALAEGAKSAEVSRTLDDQSTYSSDGTELLSTLGPIHTVKLANGEEVSARQHSVFSYDEGAPEGGPYRLVTKRTEGAQIEGKPEQDVRTTTTSYGGQSNLGWTLREPTSVTTDPSGLKLTSIFVYDSATGNILEARKPASGGEGNPHDVKTVYYTTAANGTYPACGSHPEWANLVCETLPGAQPETSGIPNLPVTTTTYNSWLEPAVVTKAVGAETVTTTDAYDEGGRLTKTSVSSTVGTALPTVTDEYETSTGLLTKQKTTVEGVTSSLTSAYNTLGELASYTDADGVASTYEYDIDGRQTFVNDGKGTQSVTYSTTSGLETGLTDSAVGKITATYDVEGNLVSEKAPDGIKATFTYNAAGTATKLEDKKTTSCGSSCTWFSQTEVPSIHDQTASQSTSLLNDTYKYDEAGRLTEVTETPTGQGCVTRTYAYDAEDNRTSLTSREPASEGKCATSGGTVGSHTYDSGNRLTDSGVKYDPFGDTTTLPAGDAGGSELSNTFYADNRLASMSQAGETISYRLDPSRRTREIVSTGTTNATVVNHYTGEGDSPSWNVDLAGKWTRYIRGIGTGLAAIQYNGESPVMQLSDLEGNIVATASSSSTATALLSTTRNTEYGVPTTGSPAKYSWLGAELRSDELPSGVVAMGARGYVPQLGRFLQMDPVAGGSVNPYGYTDGDPVNSSDLTGAYVESDYLDEFNSEWTVESRIAEEEAAREEAERKAEAAEAAAEAAAARGGRRQAHHHGHGHDHSPATFRVELLMRKGGGYHCDKECRKEEREVERHRRVKKRVEKEEEEKEKKEKEKEEIAKAVGEAYYEAGVAVGSEGG